MNSTLADGASCAARLTRAGLGLAWHRFGSGDVPRTLADVDAAWLSRALSSGFPGVAVRCFEVVDRHAGTTARARLHLEFETSSGAPEHLFLKLAPPGVVNRLFVVAAGLARGEVGFYRDIRSARGA